MVLGIKLGQNKPRNVQNLHRCQRDKSPLMASDMEAYAFWHLTRHRLGAYTKTGGQGAGGGWREGPTTETEHHASELCNYFWSTSNINLRAMQII